MAQPGQQIPGQPQTLTMEATFPNDPSLPPELRGRPVADALAAYNTMREDFLKRNGVRPPQGPPPAAPQPQAPAAQGQQPPQGQPAQNPRDSFFRNPESAIDARLQAFETRLMERLGPVFEQSTRGAVDRSLAQVRGEFPDFARYEGQIMAQLKNAPPDVLSNPESFRTAYKYVIGEETLKARQAGTPPAPRWVPAPGTPPQQFFTEAPTPNGGQQINAQGVTPQMEAMAKRFGIPVQEYVAWSGGNVPPAGGNGNGR